MAWSGERNGNSGITGGRNLASELGNRATWGGGGADGCVEDRLVGRRLDQQFLRGGRGGRQGGVVALGENDEVGEADRAVVVEVTCAEVPAGRVVVLGEDDEVFEGDFFVEVGVGGEGVGDEDLVGCGGDGEAGEAGGVVAGGGAGDAGAGPEGGVGVAGGGDALGEEREDVGGGCGGGGDAEGVVGEVEAGGGV